ncbi:MAG: hypothetical protein ACR2NF_03480 [Pirellulales bacterium]
MDRDRNWDTRGLLGVLACQVVGRNRLSPVGRLSPSCPLTAGYGDRRPSAFTETKARLADLLDSHSRLAGSAFLAPTLDRVGSKYSAEQKASRKPGFQAMVIALSQPN